MLVPKYWLLRVLYLRWLI